jgi:hypothetical protein
LHNSVQNLVEDFNSALALNKIEPIYGLSRSENAQLLTNNNDNESGSSSSGPSSAVSSKEPENKQFNKLINLGTFCPYGLLPFSTSQDFIIVDSKFILSVEYGKRTLVTPCPLKPELVMHWLSVNGNQPLIAENPSVVSAEAIQQPLSLPKELQVGKCLSCLSVVSLIFIPHYMKCVLLNCCA